MKKKQAIFFDSERISTAHVVIILVTVLLTSLHRTIEPNFQFSFVKVDKVLLEKNLQLAAGFLECILRSDFSPFGQ